MPGHKVAVDSRDLKYQCPHCKLLLKDAIQPLCGHRLCESCADELLDSVSPKCPRADCQEDLRADADEGAEYFPDRFVRREIEGLIVSCSNRPEGCQWEDRLVKLDDHRNICSFAILDCQCCGKVLPIDQMESHRLLACPKALIKCPLAEFGCQHTQQITREELRKHIATHSLEHFEMMADALQLLKKQTKHHIKPIIPQADDDSNATGKDFSRMSDGIERDCAVRKVKSKEFRATDGLKRDYAGERVKSKADGVQISPDPLTQSWKFKSQNYTSPEMESFSLELQSPKGATPCVLPDTRLQDMLQRDIFETQAEKARLEHEIRQTNEDTCDIKKDIVALETRAMQASSVVQRSKHADIENRNALEVHAATTFTLKNSTSALEAKFIADLKRKDEEISTLRNNMTKLEKAMRSKHAEFEDRDFRLSLIENSSHDGNMIWKIPQFSQRMADAQSGRYTSIFSLPFYTGRDGYKMCLRLYILGDGIGKNTHMSLFFIIMKGEFDNSLQWPFTSKVIFKLINRTGNRDIIDTFQPDPMSISFQKPKSDMNIASGCPRFVSHAELDGFIADDMMLFQIFVYSQCI